MNIGMIGTGNIAAYLLEQVNAGGMADGRITAVFGRNQEAGNRLHERFGIDFYTDYAAFLETPLDLVVEAASVEAAALYLKEATESGRDIVVGSVGVFKDETFLKELTDLAKQRDCRIFLPSGAIGGLDVLQSAKAAGGLKRVEITTKKSPASLGVPADVEGILFEGTAFEAIGKFPKNINVALVLSIAGIGAQGTNVRIIADPAAERNTHTIEAEGDFGRMRLEIENNPMPANPKTSLLAAMSILAVLQNRDSALRVGN